MAWKVTQLQVDFTQNRVMITLNDQEGNDWRNVNVNFPRGDADRGPGADQEARLKAEAKQILLDAANSL